MPFGKYAKHGWVLTPIARGTKAPTNAGWNLRQSGVTEPDVADELDGAGLMHAYSGTCAIDVDDMPAAVAWCATRNIDLPGLFAALDSVQISSGKAKHGKLLYALPEPMRGKQVSIDKQAVIDFRCATATGASQQDVLPPSMHPDTGKPYGWVLGDPLVADWQALPRLPDELRAAWLTLIQPAPAEPSAAPSAIPLELAAIAGMLEGCDPDAPRDEWVKVLAAVHYETKGSALGLDLADVWSARGKKYTGRADIETRWRSFNLDHPKPITAASLRKDTAATADEFEDVPSDAPPAGSPPSDVKRLTKEQKAEAKKELETRLVYVRTADRYFDKETQDLIAGDHALAHRFTPMMPRFQGRRLDPVKLLKESPLRGTVDSVGFHPGEGAIFTDGKDKFANCFRPRYPEPLEPTRHERDLIEWLYGRIDDKIFREWLLKFTAHIVQQPGIKIASAPLIWSEIYGNGKSTLLCNIPKLLVGAEYSQEVSYDLLNSNFTDFLLQAWHVNLTEFRAAGRGERISIANKLKPWITDARISVHPKGKPAFSIPNHLFLTATANEGDAAPLDEGDRRWGVHELTAPRMTDSETDALYANFLDTDRAPGVLRHYFLNHSLTGFRPTAAPPETAARAEMIEASVSSEVETLRTAFEEQAGPFIRDVCQLEDLKIYLREKKLFVPGDHRLGRLLRKHPFNGQMRLIRDGAAKLRVWIIRNHSVWLSRTETDVANHLRGEEVNSLPDPLSL